MDDLSLDELMTVQRLLKGVDNHLRALAYEIRAEQVCGCVEDSGDIDEWHERCCGAEFAAMLVEGHITFPTAEEKNNLTRVEKFNERRKS